MKVEEHNRDGDTREQWWKCGEKTAHFVLKTVIDFVPSGEEANTETRAAAETVNQRITGEGIDYSTQQDYLDVLSGGESDNTADSHEEICSLFSQHLAHPWEFISEQRLFQQKI